MKRYCAALLSAVLLLTGCAVKYEYAEPKPIDVTVYTRETAGIRLEDDYYGYMNFDFLYGTDIPADMPETGSIRMVGKKTEDILRQEIISAAESTGQYPEGSEKHRIRELYRQYLDTETRDKVGIGQLENCLQAIDSAGNIDELIRVLGMLYTDYGCGVLPYVYYSTHPFESGRDSLYIEQMSLFSSADELKNGKDTAEQHQQQAEEILKATGHENAEKTAYDIITMYLDTAYSTADLFALPEYERYKFIGSEELPPRIKEYLEAVGVTESEIAVCDISQLEKIDSLLTDEFLDTWKGAAKVSLIYQYKSFLPERYAKAMGGEGNVSVTDKAVNCVKDLLGGEIANLYMEKNCDEKSMREAEKMTAEIADAYRKCIEGSKLLSDTERNACIAKIDDLAMNIGCPKEKYSSEFELSGDLLGTAINCNKSMVREKLTKNETAHTSEEWKMLPQTVNAVYDPRSNSITVPMALFNAPIFDAEGDRFANLGGLGSIIAHEIGHAFDSEGILYDEKGNYRPERISTDRNDIISAQMTEYFGSRCIMDTYFVNGELTKGENAEDLGGMQVISSVANDKEDLRKIFESYASLWATLAFDTDAAESLTNDVHSPPEIRVNAVLSSLDSFYEAYDIKDTDGMYVPYDKRVRVW